MKTEVTLEQKEQLLALAQAMEDGAEKLGWVQAHQKFFGNVHQQPLKGEPQPPKEGACSLGCVAYNEFGGKIKYWGFPQYENFFLSKHPILYCSPKGFSQNVLGENLHQTLMRLNDQKGWTLKKIIEYVRGLAE